MLRLKQIVYTDIAQYDADYIRRSNDTEMPIDCAWYGVFDDSHLLSYFAVSDMPEKVLFIRRGYVLPQYRQSKSHGRTIWKQSMKLLEEAAKAANYTRIEFYSTRNPLAYSRMFKTIGFSVRYAGYQKSLED